MTRSRPNSPSNDFPVRQLVILSICRLCEPIAFCSIFPYIYYMIDSFGIAKNDNEIAMYAGMVTSAFAFAEFLTGMWWGRISDKVGRKPVLIGGLAGTMVSMILFGFAKSFPVALLARAAGGFLNGNIGVIQTTVAEMVPRKEYQPRAYAIMPFIWSIGSIIGPAVGGALADPIRQYPEIFKPGGFFEEYPYSLPNLFASAVLIIGVCVGILFLEETHAELKHQKDHGRELGKRLVALASHPFCRSNEDSGDRRTLIEPDGAVSGATYNTFSEPSSTTASVENEPLCIPPKPLPLKKTFTPQIIHLIISYGILALHTIAFEQLFPVFLSTPKADEAPSSWFKFVGGYGLSTREIGFILTVQGSLAMLIQFILFPPMVRKFGAFHVYIVIMVLYPFSYIFFPYLDFIPDDYKYAGIYTSVVIRILFGSLSYPCNMILLTNSAPSLLVLGTINGIAASVASLARSFGPTISGMLYSYGLDIGYVGLVWWINAGICVIGAVQALWILNPSEEMNTLEDIDDMDEEAVDQIAVEATVRATTAGVACVEECVNEFDIIHRVISNQA
ncbi:MFS general substrate transporter [Terfezia boudieri ATCC MYA-4762]|uniref:MFS general substrate transporter n=1 Tax=Terfezia boudieri ATCC MYA-4762 TaxID=1051890 RepID=A0A3N4M179_9PEZI|nr:MFS general substrate transporter [Terfezia boudieri ATCC MYA-4762]